MKKRTIILAFLMFLLSFSVSAQVEEKQLSISQLLDADAAHDLNVAWQYFRLKKAYLAVLLRTEVTMVAHPSFAKMDEVLYLSGMSSYYLSEGKGKQKIDLTKLPEDERDKFKPENLRDDAIAYLAQLMDDHPESKYAEKARSTFKKLQPDK